MTIENRYQIDIGNPDQASVVLPVMMKIYVKQFSNIAQNIGQIH